MSKALRVLTVEDSEDDTLLLALELRQGGYHPAMQRVDTAQAFAEALDSQVWDLIIADYNMPHFSGLTALQLVQARGLDIPFIIVSGYIDEATAVAAMKSGAQDYLMKDNLKRLAPAVARELRDVAVRRERRQAEEALRASQERIRQANAALFQLARMPELYEGDLPRAFAEITEIVGRTLDIARISVWLLSADHSQFVCHDLYDLTTNQHTAGLAYTLSAHPRYATALQTNQIIVAGDPAQDERLSEFLAEYYAPAGILAVMEAVVRHQGQVVGVFSLEQTGGVRPWMPEEELFANSVADLVALALSAAERQRNQEALRLSEQRYRELFENAQDMIFTMDPRGLLTSVNRSAERLLGYDRAEMIGHRVFEFLAIEYHDAAIEHYQAKLSGEQTVAIHQAECICKDGSRLPIEVSTRLIFEGEHFVGVQGIVRNLSARKKIEAALRQSEQRYRDLFENANDIIYTLDLEGYYTSVNQRAEELTGYTRTEIIGRHISEAIAPEYHEYVDTPLHRKLTGEMENTVYELEVFCKDGRRLPLEVSTRLIYSAGQPAGVQGIARDISERRYLEEQLRHSQKMEAIGRLAGAIAHDFNNLLTAILGYSQILKRRVGQQAQLPRPQLLRDVGEIIKASERAAALTQQLLAFSRRQMAKLQVIELNEVVREVAPMLHRLISEDIQLVTELTSAPQRIRADRNQIEQVIVNLAINSRDAMPGGGQLLIATTENTIVEGQPNRHPHAKAGTYAVLLVQDNGIGMDRTTQSRIFEPFFTTKEVGRGTGLGLSTVYGIVRQSDGFIEVESEVGRGSTFRIHFPYASGQPVMTEKPSLTKSTANGSETILLAEDDEAVRNLLKQTLEMHGHKVLAAETGLVALHECHHYPGAIAALITDLVMPQMSGAELSRRVREVRPQIKVLYMSGYADRALLNDLESQGVTQILEKPFTPDSLIQRLRELLRSAA
jgi:PAS domain S-box-containing protein